MLSCSELENLVLVGNCLSEKKVRKTCYSIFSHNYLSTHLQPWKSSAMSSQISSVKKLHLPLLISMHFRNLAEVPVRANSQKGILQNNLPYWFLECRKQVPS